VNWFRWAALVIATAMVVLFAVFIWPTRYRYEHWAPGGGRSYPVRINRFTGTAERLQPNGWQPMK
jgi:hypothetical protein